MIDGVSVGVDVLDTDNDGVSVGVLDGAFVAEIERLGVFVGVSDIVIDGVSDGVAFSVLVTVLVCVGVGVSDLVEVGV